jgi:xylulose-5-phosphate/fructose-6-phosphate phosphoketolase
MNASIEPAEQVCLRNGLTVVARAVTLDDEHALWQFLTELSDDSRRLRFFTAGADLRAEARRGAAADDVHHHGIVALVPGRGVVGHATCVRAGDTERAEVAVEVADDLHHLGLATLMMIRLARWAEGHQITQFYAEVLPENRDMLAVFHDAFVPTTRITAGAIELEFPTSGWRAAHARFDRPLSGAGTTADAPGSSEVTMTTTSDPAIIPVDQPELELELELLDRYWRAANYLSVGQIYLLDNPLLREPLQLEHIKPRLLGHWGTTPGLNFIYAHVNRLIRARDLNVIYVAGPGHGGPGLVANTYLEGTYSEVYPHIGRDAEGLRRLFRQFSFPGGIPSHVAPETPGSIHEGGELGYALVHAYGAAFDNPDLLVCCVIGDGEAETGPLAASWHSNKFLNAARDGAVLPILHLNGYKIANPTILARIPEQELRSLLEGYGYAPRFVEGSDPTAMHALMASTLDEIAVEIDAIQHAARAGLTTERPRWPMIVLRTPKGWTGPKEVDGLPAEGSFRSHQVPLTNLANDPGHVAQLEAWMRSYRPEELFDETGALRAELAALAPRGERRMGSNPHANGGVLLRDLELPDFRSYAADVPEPARAFSEATTLLGAFLRDVVRLNAEYANFRLFGPDETASNRLSAVFEATDRVWQAETLPTDDHLAADGRVMEVLSEHLCEGWLEGYLLTGRHGLFNCYEAFIHIIDSMFNQHAKWLKVTREIEWRAPIASLNYLLSSHVWRQDHNGFSHQDPGFIDHVVNKKAEIVRVYLPPDANCLLSVADHCLRSRGYVNVIVAGKQPALDYLTIDEAVAHCTRGLGIWNWAGNDQGGQPDVVMACAGDIPTLETIAAAALLREHLPDLRVRVINVVDLMRLEPESEHPHGLSDPEFDALFTNDRPVIFAYHGYPWLIHRLTYRRHNHDNIHVRGYKEEGTTTTPFDMLMLNDMDRFHLAIDVIDRVPSLGSSAAGLRQQLADQRLRHRAYTREVGDDPPEIRDWTWPGSGDRERDARL